MVTRTSLRVKMAEDVRFQAREQFTKKLKIAFVDKYNRAINCNYSIIHTCYVSTPVDEQPFTQEQIDFIAGFEAAWLELLDIVEKVK